MSAEEADRATGNVQADFKGKEGWMAKRGHVFKSWKRRWFVLEDHLLKYYKWGPGDPDGPLNAQGPNAQKELRGSIPIYGALVDTPEEAPDGRSFCFKLTPLSRKVFFICAIDKDDLQDWIRCLQHNSRQLTITTPISPGNAAEDDTPPSNANTNPDEVINFATDEQVTLSSFELMKVVGRGTYGKVMQVRRQDTGEIYAMKVLKKETIFARNDPKDLQHTISERNVLAMVNEKDKQHPFLVGLRYAFQTPAKLYYILDFCNGGDLYYLISRTKKFNERQSQFYAAEIFLALKHLHDLGVIYRDLKPENVLLDSDGHCRLTDFGLSKEGNKADTFCGTPVYLAPEIWMRKTYGFEVDWWSLGCLLFEMVSGLPPFWGDTIREVYKKVIHTQPKYPPMSPELKSLIEGLLKQDPNERLGHQSSDEIMKHAFFRTMNWDTLVKKEIPPPFKPKTANSEDTGNFSSAYTKERPLDSFVPDPVLTTEQQANFDQFSYVPPKSIIESGPESDADLNGLNLDDSPLPP